MLAPDSSNVTNMSRPGSYLHPPSPEVSTNSTETHFFPLTSLFFIRAILLGFFWSSRFRTVAWSFDSPLHHPEYPVTKSSRFQDQCHLFHFHCHLGARWFRPLLFPFLDYCRLYFSNMLCSRALNIAYFVSSFYIPKRHNLVCGTATHSVVIIYTSLTSKPFAGSVAPICLWSPISSLYFGHQTLSYTVS